MEPLRRHWKAFQRMIYEPLSGMLSKPHAPVPFNCPMNDLGKGSDRCNWGAGLIGSALIWGLNNRGHENIGWLIGQKKRA